MSDTLLRMEPASAFFGNTRPPALPADKAAPDINGLAGRIRTLDTAQYPLPEVRKLLIREHTRLGAGTSSMELVGKIGPDTVFIVAGQQAGLFGGPLYTLYKAMHAVRLSKVMSEQTGRKVIPLFWVASDDHDFDEVNHLGIVTPDGSPASVSAVPAGYRNGMPVGDIILDECINQALDKLEKHMSHGDAVEQYLALLRECWTPGMRWNDAFSSQMLALFARQGIVLFDPRWQGAKELFSDVMRKDLTDPLRSTELLNKAADSLDSAHDRKKALRKPADSTNLFIEIDGIRLPIRFNGDQFAAGEKTFGRDELLESFDSSPDLFSPGAAIRPVCQDAVFPVGAQIAGPGEQRYLNQLDGIYRLFGVDRSTPWPRASFTIFDRKTIRNAEKEHASLPSLFADVEKIRLDMARDTFPPTLGKTLDYLERLVNEQFDMLTDGLTSLEPTLAQGAGKDRGRILHTLDGIRTRAVRAHKKHTGVSESRLSAASCFLLPSGGPQERWFGYDTVLNVLDGDAFVELIGLCSPGEESHRVVMPGPTGAL